MILVEISTLEIPLLVRPYPNWDSGLFTFDISLIMQDKRCRTWRQYETRSWTTSYYSGIISGDIRDIDLCQAAFKRILVGYHSMKPIGNDSGVGSPDLRFFLWTYVTHNAPRICISCFSHLQYKSLTMDKKRVSCQIWLLVLISITDHLGLETGLGGGDCAEDIMWCHIGPRA